MIKTATLLLILSACTAPELTSVEQPITAQYCRDGLGPIDCWPDSPAQSNDWCMSNCGWFNDQPGFCPEYTQTERNYCASHCHTDTVNCDDFCQPQNPHHCIVGWPP
jgi:hypothetical protein